MDYITLIIELQNTTKKKQKRIFSLKVIDWK